MILTELSNSHCEFIDCCDTCADYLKNNYFKIILTYDSEAILGEETSRGENQAALFLKEFLTELDITRYILKLREVKVHHHVHSSGSTNRFNTPNPTKFIECVAGCSLQL
jgi:hypothetical protein